MEEEDEADEAGGEHMVTYNSGFRTRIHDERPHSSKIHT